MKRKWTKKEIAAEWWMVAALVLIGLALTAWNL